MFSVTVLLQVIIALGLLNVWIVRYNKATEFRGGKAQSLPEEFAAYGLPVWFCHFVGFLKIGSAIALIVGIWFPEIVMPAAALVACLMIGALIMHVKVSDPIKKSVPAFCMFVMSALIVAGVPFL